MANPSYWSRTRTLILTVITVSFTPMLLVGAVALYEFQTSYDEKVNAHLGEVVEKHKQTIDRFLDEQLSRIRFLADSSTYADLCRREFLEQRLALLQRDRDPVVVDLGLIDDKGRQVAYAGPFRLGEADYSKADWFRRALESDHIVSDVFKGLRGLPHFIVAVRRTHEEKAFILRATIDFAAFNDLVERIRIGETGFASILNHEGEFQTNPIEDFALDRGPWPELLSTESGRDGVRIVERPDEDGNGVLYVAAHLKGGEWLLVYQQSTEDAFSSLHRARDVTLVIVLLSALAILGAAYFLAHRMVARLTQTDLERQLMNQQIVETGKLASVGELASGIAHEINNPVAIMVEEAGWVEDLLEEEKLKTPENDEEVHRALRQIKDQGLRCKEITQKLLSFARRTDSQIQDVNLVELIEEMVSLSSQRAKFAKVEILTRIEPGLPTIQASITELQQVFLNLINNALDAMEKKGGSIKISAQREGDAVTVYVADTGPGIPHANLERVFDPFFTTKPVGKGTGLGLSICYGIIKKMGGEIEARSVVNVGTTFRIQLPIRSGAGAGAKTGA